jgi:putative Ig domain-containing protein
LEHGFAVTRTGRRRTLSRFRLVAAGAITALTVGAAWCCPAVASTGTAATGSIQTINGSNLADGATFTISDGTHAPTIFEFDSNGAVTTGNLAVPFTNAQLATTVKTTIINTINGVGAGLTVTASSGGSTLVALVNDNVGSAGNASMTETVVDPVFTVSGMSGGDASPVLAAIGDKIINQGAQLQFTISAADADPGDFLTYSALNLPTGATFDPSSRLFSWTPTAAQVGTYSGVRLQTSDGTLGDFDDITITVASTQQQSQPPGATGATGQRSAALEKCLKKRTRKARKKCGKRALQLPL